MNLIKIEYSLLYTTQKYATVNKLFINKFLTDLHGGSFRKLHNFIRVAFIG